MSDFSFFSDLILNGLETTDIFTPVMLIRLVGFMLMLEFMGGVFGVAGNSISAARKG